MAVTSVKNNTSLSPHLLYYGKRNDFTAWMEREGVVIHDVKPALEDLIYSLEAEGRYSSAYMGHWLRAEICQLEKEDEYVLYTDCDVVFCKDPDIEQTRPEVFACAPEFKQDSWNYFNSGVMIMNVPALAAGYPEFIEFASSILQNDSGIYNDQFAFNHFYRKKWSRLDLNLNWKPYWPYNPDTKILHFHGPKIGVIKQVLGSGWKWDTGFGTQMGSLLAGHRDEYRAALMQAHQALAGTNHQQIIEDVLNDLDQKHASLPLDKVNLDFMNFKLFAD